MASRNSYDSSSIKILTDIEHIRTRKGVYIGDALDPRQLIYEAIDNAVDEVQAGYSDELVVTVDTEENRYSVRDFGRGIPHGLKRLDNGELMETVEVIFTKSNSGGKFDNSSYMKSIGTNGLGTTIINALSKELLVISHRDGRSVILRASNGEVESVDYSISDKKGTLVSFIPDESMFRSKSIPISVIENRCKITSAMGYTARLVVDGEEHENVNANMFDLITEDEDVSTYCQFNIINVKSDNEEEMKVALRYTSDVTDRYFGYTNMLFNSIGGTHVHELSKVIIESWKEFLEKNKSMRPDTELRNSDFLVGLRAVCAVFILKPEYSSQTKEKLTVDKKYFSDLMSRFKAEFLKELQNDTNLAKSLLKRFEEYRISQNKLLARKEISSIIKINNDDPTSIRRRSIISKLKDCTSKSREKTELFITEGDSASGSLIRTRNKELQAVLSLRGRILNVTNMSPKDAIKSQEICNIANSVGCGIGSSCDSARSRYSKIIYVGDEDADGKGITNLVISAFVNLMADVVKSGMLYIARTPLYVYNIKGQTYGCNRIEDIPKGVRYTRIKGLGEFEDDQIKKFIMSEATRSIYQVTYPSDIKEFNHILGTSVGKSSLLKDLGIIVDIRRNI